MVFEDGFWFFFLLLRASPPNGGFFYYLFQVVKAEPTHLTYVMTTNQHIYPSSTHSRLSFIILAFSYTFTVLIFSPTLHEKDVEAFIRTSVEAKFPSHAYVQHQVFLLAIDFQPFFFSFFALGRINSCGC